MKRNQPGRGERSKKKETKTGATNELVSPGTKKRETKSKRPGGKETRHTARGIIRT